MINNARFIVSIATKNAAGFYIGKIREAEDGMYVASVHALTLWGLKRELRKWLKDQQLSGIVAHATVDSNNKISITKRKETK